MKKLVLVLAAVALVATGGLAGWARKRRQAPAAPEIPAVEEAPAAAETPAAEEAKAEKEVPAADPLPENAKAAPQNHVVIVPAAVEKKSESKPAEKPAPTPAPAPVPTPVVLNPPVVTMNPSNVTVMEGGTFTVSARYSNAIWAVWHFVSPDGTRDMTYEEMSRLVPTMSVENGMYSDMTLRNVTLGLNGWKVYCRYSNNDGFTNTAMAYITVYPDNTPRRTGIAVEVYYLNSNATILYAMSDGSFMTDEGAVYYQGDDGVFRSRGNGDLYMEPPVLGPTRTGFCMEVFYYNSNATTIYEMSDGSWMTEEGAVYYRGDDGVFRSRGNGDLYIQPPELG